MQRKEGDCSRAAQGATSAAVAVRRDTQTQPNAQLWIRNAEIAAKQGMKRHCFSKAVRDVAQGNEEEESFYLGAVSPCTTDTIIACHVNTVHSCPVSQLKLDMIRAATEENEQLQRV